MVCVGCRRGVGKGWAQHLRSSKHAISFPSNDELHVNSTYQPERSPYLADVPGYLEAVDFLPRITGYGCNLCLYFCGSVKSIRKHVRGHEDRVGDGPFYSRKPVQRVGTGKKSHFHGVRQPEVLDPRVPIGAPVPEGELDPLAVLASAMRSGDNPAEAVRNTNPFYISSGWVPRPDQADMFEGNDINSYVQPTFRTTEDEPVEEQDLLLDRED